MSELWSFIGALVASAVMALFLIGGYIATNAFAIGWRAESKALLGIHLLRWRWEDGLAKTSERRFWERRYFAVESTDPALSVGEWRAVTVAFAQRPSDVSSSPEQWERRLNAVQFRALRRLHEWADTQTSVDAILRNWWWRSLRERCSLSLVGVRYVGRPALMSLTDKLCEGGAPVLAWAPAVALAIWGLSPQRGDAAGDWIAHVGWVCAVAAVIGVVVPLLRETIRIFSAIPRENQVPSRTLTIGVFGFAVLIFAAQYFGVLEQVSSWIDAWMRRTPQDVLTWVIAGLFASWVLWRVVVVARANWRRANWRRPSLWLPSATYALFTFMVIWVLFGSRWFTVDRVRSVTLAVGLAVTAVAMLWGLQSGILWGKKVWCEYQAVSSAGGIDLGGFYPKTTLIATVIWLVLLIMLIVVDPETASGWLSLAAGLLWLGMSGGWLLPQAILGALWRRRLRLRFEQIETLDMDTVVTNLQQQNS
ncbi:hypothetical protein [Knoellia subterranea]|nr:hypothetical protein [Knoellia subterranea]